MFFNSISISVDTDIYQWQRAETLGALVNGVFLVALCLSIFLDAIQRFVEPQVVSNPRLVLIVGCFGLLSNILGLFLFHEHGHSHGGEHGAGHVHGERDDLAAAEQGYSPAKLTTRDGDTETIADESGNVADVLPQSTIAGWPKTTRASSATNGSLKKTPLLFSKQDEDANTATMSTSPASARKSLSGAPRHRRHTSGGSRSRFASVDEMHIHPASFRNDIIKAGRLEDIESGTSEVDDNEEALLDEEATEEEPLLSRHKSNGYAKGCLGDSAKPKSHDHAHHKHGQAKEHSKGGHSHGDLNMRGVFLHVMGDALGNIGVIGSALIIWLTSWSWRYYADPAISLVITVIILGSAIPLCKAASRILLQAVPPGISVDDIKTDIEDFSGIISCHHVHVWQLSDTKMVASLHIQVEFDFKGEGSARYMQLARAIRRCLHEHGIHSSTIQPEFCLDSSHRHISGHTSEGEDDHPNGPHEGNPGSKGASKRASRAGSIRSQPDTCLLECGDECGEAGQCCTPSAADNRSFEESRQQR
ncbi:MAG: hypothetical protein Q9211_001975 [Gyalolechia sp. 1 TL-2023]